MIYTLNTGIVLAAISGLTFIAYKHPKGYLRLHIPLTIIIRHDTNVPINVGFWRNDCA